MGSHLRLRWVHGSLQGHVHHQLGWLDWRTCADSTVYRLLLLLCEEQVVRQQAHSACGDLNLPPRFLARPRFSSSVFVVMFEWRVISSSGEFYLAMRANVKLKSS